MDNDSNQQKNSADLRKSKRARKPNSFYVQGIAQAKKPIPKTKKKGKPQEEDYYSYTEQKDQRDFQQLKPYDFQNSDQWLSCQMPDSTKLKVSVYFKGVQNNIVKKKKQEKVQVKPKAQTDLLSLFQKAIEGVAVQQPPPKQKPKTSVIEFEPIVQLHKAPSQSYRVPHVKKVKQDKEGRIQKVSYQNGHLKFIHSKLGQIEFQTTWSPSIEQQEKQEEINIINQMKMKLSSYKNIPSILM